MDAGKYSRSITLLCPTCGGDQFEFEGGDLTVETAGCAGCGREFRMNSLRKTA